LALFNQLHDRIFAPLASPSAKLYEQALLAIYGRFYRNHQEFPSRDEIVSTVREILEGRPELWLGEEGDEETSEGAVTLRAQAQVRAKLVVRKLIDCGWLEESKSGFAVQVDFTPSGIHLMKSLADIDDGSNIRVEGALALLTSILGNLANGQSGFASGLDTCVRQLDSLRNAMRATYSRMHNIRDEVMKGKSNRERFTILMTRYVGDVFQHDLKHLMSERHPYRYRYQTIATIRSFTSDEAKMQRIGSELAELHFKAAMESPRVEDRIEAVRKGVEMAFSQFGDVENILERIQDVAKAIMDANGKLEEQLRVQGRYQHRKKPEQERRVEETIGKLARHIAANEETRDEPGVPFTLSDRQTAIHVKAFWEPPAPRPKIGKTTFGSQDADPLMDYRRKMDDEFLNRLSPSEDRIARFIEREMGDADTLEFDDTLLVGIDDFLVSSTILNIAVTQDVPPSLAARFSFEVPSLSDTVRSAYVRCPAFIVRRNKNTRGHRSHA
jgi:hypothetical protein